MGRKNRLDREWDQPSFRYRTPVVQERWFTMTVVGLGVLSVALALFVAAVFWL